MPRATSGMDMNGKIAALLRDFAAIQKSKQSMWGYKRAANAILTLDEPIESFLQPDGTLRKIPNIGPSSTRVILEVLQTGSSPTIEKAIGESGQSSDIERRRELTRSLSEPRSGARRPAQPQADGPAARGLPRRPPDALDLERRQPVARRHHRGRDRARLQLLRRHRPFVRVEDRRRRDDGRARAAASRDRSAEPEAPRRVPAAQGD